MTGGRLLMWPMSVKPARLRGAGRGRLALGMLLVVVNLGFPLTSGIAAPLGPTWAVSVMPMPNGTTNVNPSPLIESTVCVAVDECVMVGQYTADNGSEDGLILTFSASKVTSIAAPNPANAAADPEMLLDSLSCTALTFCVAGGFYTDSHNGGQAALETRVGNTWSVLEAPLPPDAATDPESGVFSVACVRRGDCLAVGNYTTTAGAVEPFVDTLDTRGWTPALLPLPTDAAANPMARPVTVRCSGAENCVMVGRYGSTKGAFLPFADTLSDGVWTSQELPLPPAANPSDPGTAPVSMSCPAEGSCVVVGQYRDDQGSLQGLIVQLAGGRWSPLKAPIPGGAAVNPKAVFTSVSCPVVGRCAAAGSALLQDDSLHGILLQLSGGQWTPSVVPTPDPTDQTGAVLSTVACARPGTCAAAGSTIFEGILVTLRDGSLQAVTAAAPAPVVPEGPTFENDSMACPSPSWCIAGADFPKEVAGHDVVYGVVAVLSELRR